MKPDLLLKCTTAGRRPHLQLAMVPWEEGEFVFQLIFFSQFIFTAGILLNKRVSDNYYNQGFFVRSVFPFCCRYERAPADPYMTRRYVFA
jgi:hypothetical protein